MKVHRISKSLLGLFIAYFIVFAYSYGRFLQIPIFPNEVILWKSVFEQLTSWIPPVIAYCLLFVAIAKNGQRRANAAKTNMLALLASFILIFLLAFSIGIHAAAQMVEDFIIEQKGTTLFQFVWFFDEYVGHTFLLFLSMLLGLLAYFELGTKPQNSSKIGLRITELMGLLNGSLWGVSGVEGGSMYIALVPLSILVSLGLVKRIQTEKLNLNQYLFTRHFLISVLALIIFTFFWILKSSPFSQPSDFGFTLFSI